MSTPIELATADQSTDCDRLSSTTGAQLELRLRDCLRLYHACGSLRKPLHNSRTHVLAHACQLRQHPGPCSNRIWARTYSPRAAHTPHPRSMHCRRYRTTSSKHGSVCCRNLFRCEALPFVCVTAPTDLQRLHCIQILFERHEVGLFAPLTRITSSDALASPTMCRLQSSSPPATHWMPLRTALSLTESLSAQPLAKVRRLELGLLPTPQFFVNGLSCHEGMKHQCFRLASKGMA